jgi:hypothetical protein
MAERPESVSLRARMVLQVEACKHHITSQEAVGAHGGVHAKRTTWLPSSRLAVAQCHGSRSALMHSRPSTQSSPASCNDTPASTPSRHLSLRNQGSRRCIDSCVSLRPSQTHRLTRKRCLQARAVLRVQVAARGLSCADARALAPSLSRLSARCPSRRRAPRLPGPAPPAAAAPRL